MPRDSQDDMPLYAAVRRALAAPGTRFATPGHKLAAGFVDDFLACDMPLTTGVEDSRLSLDLLGRTQRLAADLWGGDRCWFAVNGSTQGNQALALAAARPGERVAVARTMHKSSFAGLLLAGLEPVWLYPDLDPGTGLTAGVPVEEVRRALARGARAVLLVEPAYTGVLSDVAAIARLTRAAGVPLIVDQAWGAHLGFHPALPANALRQGADAMVVSAHKTLPAFTQSSMVFTRGERLDAARVDAAFELLNTTSPSAAIYGSLDSARHLLATRGAELLAGALALADHARATLAGIDGLRVLDPADAARWDAVAAVDPIKLVLSLAGTGANGFEVERDLLAAGVTLELADRDTLVPMLTVADDDASVGTLLRALTASLRRRRGPARAVAPSAAWSVRPELAMTPRDAFFAPSERVPASAAAGRISAETAAPYPPGVPAVAPGEVLTAPLLEALREEAAAGTRVAYCSDPTLATVLVVAD